MARYLRAKKRLAKRLARRSSEQHHDKQGKGGGEASADQPESSDKGRNVSRHRYARNRFDIVYGCLKHRCIRGMS